MHASNVILLAKLTDTFRLHKHIELNYKWKQFIPDQNSVKSKPTKANLDRERQENYVHPNCAKHKLFWIWQMYNFL